MEESSIDELALRHKWRLRNALRLQVTDFPLRLGLRIMRVVSYLTETSGMSVFDRRAKTNATGRKPMTFLNVNWSCRCVYADSNRRRTSVWTSPNAFP